MDNVPTTAIYMFCKLSGVKIFTLLFFSQWKFDPLLGVAVDFASFDRQISDMIFFSKNTGAGKNFMFSPILSITEK